MLKLKLNKRSINSYFTAFTIITFLFNTLLLVAMLLAGGVFQEAKMSSFKAFGDTVINRSDYLMQNMKKRWTNIDPFLLDLRNSISDTKLTEDEQLQFIIDNLTLMLKSTEASGAYIILKSDNTNNRHAAVYLRNYEPLSSSNKVDNIYMVYGPAKLARKNKLPLDSSWQSSLLLTADHDFFTKPIKYGEMGIDPMFVGYWSQPFQLADNDIPIITYSMPLQNTSGNTIGIVGIELTISHLIKFLPSSDLEPRDSLGYILARKNKQNNIYAMLTTNNIQKRFINTNQPLDFKLIDNDNNIFIFLNSQTREQIHASIVKLDIYPHTSPFQDEEWYLVGFIRSDFLLGYVNKIGKILKVSVFASLVLGIASGIFASRKMSKPVINLVNQVRESNKTKPLALQPTGLSELDELSDAMIQANKLILNSASRLSRVIDMVGLPIGAFEINKQYDQVSVTENIFNILEIENLNEETLKSKNGFYDILKIISSNPEPGEENIYKLRTLPPKWVKIKISEQENQVNGIIQDVTDEMLEKNKIKLDRDLDHLTGLLNRKSFQWHYERWYENRTANTAALVMFDLDSLKVINDVYGHKWGDYYIIEASKQLSNITCSDKLLLGRRSGDEFVMLLYNFTNKDEIRNILVDFYTRLNNYILDFPDGTIGNIEISAGFVWVENPEIEYDQLLHYADEALYYSKQYNTGYFTEGSY